jgi:hypothetical protein
MILKTFIFIIEVKRFQKKNLQFSWLFKNLSIIAEVGRFLTKASIFIIKVIQLLTEAMIFIVGITGLRT